MAIRFSACAVGLALALAAAGCGATTSSSDNEKMQELEQRVQDAESQAADAKADAEAARADDASSDATPDAEELADDTKTTDETSDGGCIKVPNVVGKDHQLAQDTMQAAGLYVLSEEDATGQGRMLLLDRNWTTVRQRPKAGSCVSEDTEITLYAVKDDER